MAEYLTDIINYYYQGLLQGVGRRVADFSKTNFRFLLRNDQAVKPFNHQNAQIWKACNFPETFIKHIMMIEKSTREKYERVEQNL